MTTLHDPISEEAAAHIVHTAAAVGVSLSIEGGGTRRIGQKPEDADTLSTHNLTGIVAYNPAEMTMTAKAGTPLEEIEADIIRLAIGHYRGRMTEVARRLGIGRSTLYRKLGELGIGDAA